MFNPSKTLTYGPQINTLPMRCDSSATSTKSLSAGIKSSLTSVSKHKLPSGVLQLVKVAGLEMLNPTAPLCGSFGALPVNNYQTFTHFNCELQAFAFPLWTAVELCANTIQVLPLTQCWFILYNTGFYFLFFFFNMHSKEACKAVNIFTDTMETNTNTGVGGTLPNTFLCC